MLLRIIVLLLAWMPIATSVEGSLWSSLIGGETAPKPNLPRMIRVLIIHDQPGVVLETKGKYKLYDPNDNSHISTRFIGKRRYIQALRDGIRWGEEFPGIYQLAIVPESQATTTVVDGVEYRGSIYVYDIGGTISIVNEVYVEDYLQSILAPQYRDPSTPEELLAAIAIAARTTAYYQTYHPGNKYWDIDGRKVGYQGYAAANLDTPIERVIEATRYLIMSKSSDKAAPEPFLAQLGQTAANAQISFEGAQEMSKKGDNAAQILAQAFPGNSLLLVHHESVLPKAPVQTK